MVKSYKKYVFLKKFPYVKNLENKNLKNTKVSNI